LELGNEVIGPETCPVRRLPAAEIESVVVDQLRSLLRAPELFVRTFMAARQEDEGITEAEVRETPVTLDPLSGTRTTVLIVAVTA
jgi:hypothetical protein